MDRLAAIAIAFAVVFCTIAAALAVCA